MWPVIVAVWCILVDVTSFWQKKFLQWRHRRSPREIWVDRLRNANNYEEWEEAAVQLDGLLGLDRWRNNQESPDYDHRMINERLASIKAAREEGKVHTVINHIYAGLIRNLGNIAAPKLYNRSFAGTKVLIEDYIVQVVDAIQEISSFDQGAEGVNLNTQMKLDFVQNTRQAFGRSSLVLQGGAVLGLCHFGVIKALFLQNLLPRIITGTAAGALVAALVCIYPESELPAVLQGNGIDLSAFANNNGQAAPNRRSLWNTLMRSVRRFREGGYLLDVAALEECVRTNVGDLTFEQAYNRSKRVLNITVVDTTDPDGTPNLLNYITTPHVLVRTAAIASSALDNPLHARRETTVLCRNHRGEIVPWEPLNAHQQRPWIDEEGTHSGRSLPLQRVSELFNVNHFIISQARPFLVPFMRSDMHGPSLLETHSRAANFTAFVLRMMGWELRHWLHQMKTIGVLPTALRRFVVDEIIPGTNMTLVPIVTPGDFIRLLERPTRETLEYWVLRGERSVWPAVAALKIRCGIETELDRAYQQAQRLKAGGMRRKSSIGTPSA